MTGCQPASAAGELQRMTDPSTSSGAAQDEPKELPLWNAALAWCEPSLVQELLDALPGHIQAFGFKPEDNPFPSHAVRSYAASWSLAKIVGAGPDPEGATAFRRLQAAHLVAEDFRNRFEAGEIILDGLQVKPQLNTMRSAVPQAWASLLKFDWNNSSLWAADARFIQVTGRRRQVSEAGAAGPRDGKLRHGRQRSSARGRPPFPMAAMVAIATERRGLRKPNKKQETTELLKAFHERFPNEKPPTHRTVYDHVNEIYAKVAAGAAALFPRK